MRRLQAAAREWLSVSLSLFLVLTSLPASAASSVMAEGIPVAVPAVAPSLQVGGPAAAPSAAALLPRGTEPLAPLATGLSAASPAPTLERAERPARAAQKARPIRETLVQGAQLIASAAREGVLAAASLGSRLFDGKARGPQAPMGAPGGASGSAPAGGNGNGNGNGGGIAVWRPAEAPVIKALRFALFPGHKLVFTTADKVAARMLVDAHQGANGGYVVFVSGSDEGDSQKHFRIATLARITKVKVDGGRYLASIETVAEAAITGYRTDADQRLIAQLEYPAVERADARFETHVLDAAKNALAQLAGEAGEIPAELVLAAANAKDALAFANLVSQDIAFPLETKQAILADRTVVGRLDLLTRAFTEMRVANAKAKALSEEAAKLKEADGEDEPDEEDPARLADFLREKVEKKGMSKEARSQALRELKKLKTTNPNSAEFSVTVNYVRTLLDLPWGKKTTDNIDLPKAQEVLDRDHAGLVEVKRRVLEFLAVRKKAGGLKGTILCFVGPPGTGKTSIAKDIAEAIGRKYVRLPLGGIHGEAEIRGHRRTYVGAIPGKILSLLKRSGTDNPLFLLDEIDKVSSGNSNNGDPAAALLEVLDPEQNYAFNDHYLDVPYDLSEVLFVTTANSLETIPEPLRDRMEIIEFTSYTTEEKMEIVSRHALDEKAVEAGFKKGDITLTPAAQKRLIEGHTRESGVRSLRRVLAKLMRKLVWTEQHGESVPPELDVADVDRHLGDPRFQAREAEPNDVGVATGLAVGGHGGSTLSITVLAVPGSGRLRLRKQMREMLDDSANNAFAYIYSLAGKLGIDPKKFKEQDLHIAFAPAGPVDGPSAGAAMATALASRLSGRPVKKGVAMTGELTLTGRVKAIGGLKEKILAAQRAGMHTVLYPAENESDIKDLSESVRAAMKLIPVKTLDDVFEAALEPAAPGKAGQ